MKRKNFLCAICALLCIMFAFALVGCGSIYTDEDNYANFVKWQARYETEKELVALLREYDNAYKSYINRISSSSNIVFSLRGEEVLTDANVKNVEVIYYANAPHLHITLDTAGAKIFANITSFNVGEKIEIIEINGDNQSVLLAPIIEGTIGDGEIRLIQSSEATANELCGKFSAGPIKNAAIAYNAKQSSLSTRISNSNYLPSALPEEPEFLDVTSYLKKAKAMGY